MRKPLILVAIFAALILVSCRAEINASLEVEEDRSGAIGFELGTDQEFRDLVASEGLDAGELFGNADSAFGDDAEGTTYEREEGAMTFQGVRIEFEDIDEFIAAGAASNDLLSFNTISFEMDDSTAVFDATIAAPEDFSGDLPVDPSQFAGDFLSANFTLTMPGTVTVHNADEVLADGSLRWELPFLFGEATEFRAESEFGSSGFPWLWLILGIALLVGLIAVIAAVILGRRQQRQAVSDAAAAYPQDAPIASEQESPEDAG